MNIQSSALAFVTAAFVGSAADASTVTSFHLKLRYEGTYYSDGWIVQDDAEEGESWESFDYIQADAYHLDLPVYDPKLQPGDKTSFKATLTIPDDPNQYIDYFDNGGRASHCTLGHLDCSSGVTSTSPTSILWGEYQSLSFRPEIGSNLSFLYNLDYTGSTVSLDWGTAIFHNRWADFTVIDVIHPKRTTVSALAVAPVPLPTAAALLLLSLAALALVRKRRRLI